MLAGPRSLPRRPVLDWSAFRRIDVPEVGSVERLPHTVFTTSGRAAIYHALRQLDLPAGSIVLVPTYHCPTMVAPVLKAGLTVRYFGLRSDGLPDLDSIAPTIAGTSRALIASHYFGLAQSMAEVRAWCDGRGIALIEDCAHCYFGEAGDRAVGAWGDYSTASVSKFFPVPEAGLLASASHPIGPLALAAPRWKAQAKGWVDVIETAVAHDRFAGINSALRMLFRLKNLRRTGASPVPAPDASTGRATEAAMLLDCDMGRSDEAPLRASLLLTSLLPRGRIIALRQRNYRRYAERLADVRGARPLFPLTTTLTAPYVFPLWVDDADRIYKSLKALDMPVFRWDRIWPGVPALAGDVGPQWSEHVLQLLCHQDLRAADIDRVSSAVLAQLGRPQGRVGGYAFQHA